MGAKPAHIDKYIDQLYAPYKCNVELVESGVGEFLRPQKTLSTIRDESNCPLTKWKPLVEDIASRDHVHIHAMSVGAYTFAVAQVAAVERQISLANVSSVVWDSIVVGTEENMKRGIVESVPPAYRLSVGLATNCVMFCLRNNWPLWNRYIDAVLKLETLEHAKHFVVYSDNDPMCKKGTKLTLKKSTKAHIVDSMIDLTNGWSKSNFNFHTINFAKSKHAQHLIVHKDDYLSGFNTYLANSLSIQKLNRE